MDDLSLKKLHKCMLMIYNEISRICEGNNLTYFVVGGTLLGAVVHKNFIPWDDDLDIAMPRDDYDKFIEICKCELNDDFYLHHTSTDSNYWLSFAKIRLNGTVFLEEKRKNVNSHAGIYVDIFPFDYAPECNIFSHKLKWKLITYLNNYINVKVTGLKVKSSSQAIFNPIFNCFSIKQLSLFRDSVMRSFDTGNRNYFVDLAGGRKLDNSYFNISDILPTQMLDFGKSKVKGVKNPDLYLLQLYTSKYKIIPPVEERITHDPLLIEFGDYDDI